jgi:hypothetical protein
VRPSNAPDQDVIEDGPFLIDHVRCHGPQSGAIEGIVEAFSIERQAACRDIYDRVSRRSSDRGSMLRAVLTSSSGDADHADMRPSAHAIAGSSTRRTKARTA